MFGRLLGSWFKPLSSNRSLSPWAGNSMVKVIQTETRMQIRHNLINGMDVRSGFTRNKRSVGIQGGHQPLLIGITIPSPECTSKFFPEHEIMSTLLGLTGSRGNPSTSPPSSRGPSSDSDCGDMSTIGKFGFRFTHFLLS